MTNTIDYGLFDLDNHFYETEDAWTRHLEPEFKDSLGHSKFSLTGGGTPLDQPPGKEHWVVRPGSLKERLRKMKSADEGERLELLMEPHPGFQNREERLKLMDEQQIEATAMFSSGVSVEHRFDDPRALYAHFRALNMYIEDEWGYAYKERIYAPAMLSLRDLDMAIEELDRVMANGARLINLRPGHAYGRSPGDPYFDPFWSRINEAGLGVTFHQGEGGMNLALAPLWGLDPDPPAVEQSAWQWMNTYGNAPIMSVLSSLLYDNLFHRFPNIRVASVENGATWLPYFMQHIDKMRGMGRQGPWIGGGMPERPTAVAKRHILVCPYPEDDVQAIVDQVGWEMIAMGSDYPHSEGMAHPVEFADLVKGLNDDQQRWILRDNGMSLVGR